MCGADGADGRASNFSCNGDGLGNVVYPGITDLGDGNTNYNDRLNSFKCFESVGQE